MRVTVTIARQLGCGGSEIGQRVAAALQVRCLDREIVSRTAQQLDLTEKELAAREERVSSFWERMLRGFIIAPPEAAYVAPPFPTLSDQELFQSETEVMKTITRQEDCVIVGRAACHVLPAHPGMVNIFLHAPLPFRIRRVMEFYHAPTEGQARAMIEYSDGMRGRSIAQMTGRDWADAKNYHLCLDTSTLPLPQTSDLLIEFIQHRVANVNGGGG